MGQVAGEWQVSDDGLWWWDGLKWRSTLSKDGRQRWDGRQWVPFEAAPTEPPSITATMIAPAAAFATAAAQGGQGSGRAGFFAGLGGRRRRVLVAAAAIALLAVLALAGRGLLGGSFKPSLAATTVKLGWRPGQVVTYHLAMGMDGSLNLGSAGPSVPIRFDLKGAETLKVLTVDASGTATVQASFSGLSGTAQGQPLPASSMPGTAEFRISSDGRIVSGEATGTGTGSIPGGDQVSAILPPGTARPGDTWTSTFDRPNPLGQGSLHYVTTNTFLRDEVLGGVTTAVVRSQARVPLNMTKDFGKMAALMGTGGATGSAPPGASIGLAGSVDTTSTSWVDTAARNLRQTETKAVFDLKISIHGFSGVPPSLAGGFDMKGTETLSLTS